MLDDTAHLALHEQNARYKLSTLTPQIRDGRADFGQLLEVCRLYRIAGVAALFAAGDPTALRRALRKSARMCVFGLDLVPSAERITSKLLPFFDAVAAGDVEAACWLKALAPAAEPSPLEYEEDYLFVRFLMDHVCSDVGSDAAVLLNRYRSVAAVIDDPRYGMCLALHERDAAAFGVYLEAFLESYLDRMRGIAEAGRMRPDRAATEGLCSVEGIALVRLARQAGLRLDAEYPGVPSLALLPTTAEALPPVDWQAPNE
jgi:hypothetical protein